MADFGQRKKGAFLRMTPDENAFAFVFCGFCISQYTLFWEICQ